MASLGESHAWCDTTQRQISDGHPRGWDHDVAFGGLVANPAENDANPGGCDGDVPVDGVQGGDGDDDMAPAPAGGVNDDVVTGAVGGGAQAGAVDALRRFLHQVGGVLVSIINGGTWESLGGYTQGRFV